MTSRDTILLWLGGLFFGMAIATPVFYALGVIR
jgi:hypothetical protein